MTLLQARIKARRLSTQYYVWYVRKVAEGDYQPYAHHSGDDQTVATFMNGKEVINEDN